MWNQTTRAERPVRHCNVKIPDGVERVELKKLMAPGASSGGGVSRAGSRLVKGRNGAVEQKVESGSQVVSASGG